MKGAGDRERPYPRASWRVGGQRVECVEAAGGDDLAGDVDVRRGQAVPVERGGDLVGVTPEYGTHAGRRDGRGRGHQPAALADQRQRGLGGQRARDRGRRELADAVPGDDRVIVAVEQLVGDRESERDEQRLRDRGVTDLVGRTRRPEPDQVGPGDGGGPSQPRRDLRVVEPRGQHAGGLRTLTGGKEGEHVSTQANPAARSGCRRAPITS